eukprot:COSAG05_NODE_282_length_12257_cov_5.818077_8_plen_51_part_00
MLSEEGSQQGCPLGGLLFVLSIATIVEDIAREFPKNLLLLELAHPRTCSS